MWFLGYRLNVTENCDLPLKLNKKKIVERWLAYSLMLLHKKNISGGIKLLTNIVEHSTSPVTGR